MNVSPALPDVDLATHGIPAWSLLITAVAGVAWLVLMAALSWWLGARHGAGAAAAGPIVVHSVLAGCFVAGALLTARGPIGNG